MLKSKLLIIFIFELSFNSGLFYLAINLKTLLKIVFGKHCISPCVIKPHKWKKVCHYVTIIVKYIVYKFYLLKLKHDIQ